MGCGTITGFTVTQRGRCCERGMGSKTDFSHISEMFDGIKINFELYPFYHIALLNDFGSFVLCMIHMLFESAHCSTEFRLCLLWCIARVYCGCWNLLLRCEACFFVPMQIRNGSGGGLYRECTTTLGSSTVMSSIFSSSQTEMLFTFRPALINTELPCLLYGRSTTRIVGLAWFLDRCVSWRQWQCYFLHISDSMDVFLTVRPSMFADITVSVTDGLWLWTTDMLCSFMLWKN